MNKLTIILTALLVFLSGVLVFAKTHKNNPVSSEIIQAKNFNYLLGTLDGISDELLKQHFQLYQGYVKSLNNLNSKLKECKNCPGNATYSEYRAINISKPFAQNGVVLHELYFSNLSGVKTSPSETLNKYLNRDFGSYENFILELKEAAKSARSGWVITGYNKLDNRIYNYIIDLHDEHVPVLVEPLLVFDVWEHAFAVDYGIDKPAYINAFIKNIDWNIVSKRLDSILDK